MKLKLMIIPLVALIVLITSVGSGVVAAPLGPPPPDKDKDKEFEGDVLIRGILTIGQTVTIDGTTVPNSITATTPALSFGGNDLTTTGSVTAGGGFIGNATTATDLAVEPADCLVDTEFAVGIATDGDLTCAPITDDDVPNGITIDLAATATALAADGSLCTAGNYALRVDASGNAQGCTAVVTPRPVFTTTTVDDGSVASHNSVTIGADGLPFISYRTPSDLKVAHCLDVSCTAPPATPPPPWTTARTLLGCSPR